jgi:Cu/Zn superoxide dismutase
VCGLANSSAAAQPTDDPAPAAATESKATPLDGKYTGTFANVADAPAGTGKIIGKVTMVVSKTGTVATLAVTGLDPKNVYVAHIHKQACSDGEGGTHFQFDPAGPAMPPNEIWLVPVKVTGHKGTATATSDKPVNSDAKSVVIHLKHAAGAATDEAKPPKLACADLAEK